MNRDLQRCLAAVGICLALTVASPAAVITWTGNNGTSYTDPGNWTANVPADSDWTDIARFTENSPANKTPQLTVNRKVNGLEFLNSTGWTFSGSQLTLRYVTSTSAGTNTISAPLKTAYSNYNWTVGTDNTLNLAGGLYQDSGGSIINLVGGGTMVLPNRINSWSSTLQMHIEEGLLRIEDSVPYTNSGCKVYIQSADARLQLETTLAAATNLIDTRIFDGSGFGLNVLDIGGGFVEIAPISAVADVPEPSTFLLAVLALCGLSLCGRGQKRSNK